MNEREVRMRVTEALSTMGVRAGSAIIREAEPIVEWVMAGEDEPDAVQLIDTSEDQDKAATPPNPKKKTGDKGNAPS